MSLYIMIRLGAVLAGTIGPLPYDMSECEMRAAEKLSVINADEFKRSVARTNDLSIKCEYHAQRPTLGAPDER